LQVSRIQSLGEPAIDRRQQFPSLGPFALALPEPRQAHGGAKLPPLGLLTTGYVEGLLEAGFGCMCLRNGLPQQQLSVQPMLLGFYRQSEKDS
jgi:hypothetical protein